MSTLIHPNDTPALRKVRGAFFTPERVTDFVAQWAIRAGGDRVLEPSAGDAAFMVAAVARIAKLRRGKGTEPEVDGVEIHAHSVRVARERVRKAGGKARVLQNDFFDVAPEPVYDAVIGNPPYIRWKNLEDELKQELSLNPIWNKYFNSLPKPSIPRRYSCSSRLKLTASLNSAI